MTPRVAKRAAKIKLQVTADDPNRARAAEFACRSSRSSISCRQPDEIERQLGRRRHCGRNKLDYATNCVSRIFWAACSRELVVTKSLRRRRRRRFQFMSHRRAAAAEVARRPRPNPLAGRQRQPQSSPLTCPAFFMAARVLSLSLARVAAATALIITLNDLRLQVAVSCAMRRQPAQSGVAALHKLVRTSISECSFLCALIFAIAFNCPKSAPGRRDEAAARLAAHVRPSAHVSMQASARCASTGRRRRRWH